VECRNPVCVLPGLIRENLQRLPWRVITQNCIAHVILATFATPSYPVFGLKQLIFVLNLRPRLNKKRNAIEFKEICRLDSFGVVQLRLERRPKA
jgi:hypothetical protein